MSQTHPDHGDLNGLLDSLAGGKLDDADRGRMNGLLRSSPEARQAYLEYFNIHAALAFYYSVELATDDAGRRWPPATQQPQPGVRQAAGQSLPPRMSPPAGWLWLLDNASPRVLATAVLVGLAAYFGSLLVGLIWQRAHREAAVGQFAAADAALRRDAARLASTEGCRWKSPAAAPAVGDAVGAQPLLVESGCVEIQFAGGASVVVEGPAEFIPRDAQRGLLKRGRLFAHVPPHARGFAVDTPSAEVIDLGTDFGVEVDSQGATDLHVLRGRVQVKSTAKDAPPRQQLVAGQAMRVSAGGQSLAQIPLDRRRFQVARAVQDQSAPEARALTKPLAADQPIWLGNLFDDRSVAGQSLLEALRSDKFRAAASEGSLGVDRVLYAGSPVKEIAPNLQFDATSLGWQDAALPGGHVVNDAWTDAAVCDHMTSGQGGIRTTGKQMNYNEPRIEEGIGQHANALITFDLDAIRRAGGLAGRALQFRSDRAGINDSCLSESNGRRGSVHMVAVVAEAAGIVTALVDGQPAEVAQHNGVWSLTAPPGKPLQADGQFVEFRLHLPASATWLTLIASSAGNEYVGDLAVWSGARLMVEP